MTKALPNQALFETFTSVFDLFFGQKPQKPTRNELTEHSSWNYTYVWSTFYWSHSWTNSLELNLLLTTCVVGGQPKFNCWLSYNLIFHINIYNLSLTLPSGFELVFGTGWRRFHDLVIWSPHAETKCSQRKYWDWSQEICLTFDFARD